MEETPNQFPGSLRGYHVAHKAWYAPACDITLPSITIGMFAGENGDEGTVGEMQVNWVELQNVLTPKLECFDDAFRVLLSFRDVLDAVVALEKENFTPEDFIGVLDSCGFRDLTDYTEKKSRTLFFATKPHPIKK
jgi:hypothetical protein